MMNLLCIASMAMSVISSASDSTSVKMLEEVNVVASKQHNPVKESAVSSTVVAGSDLDRINADAAKSISEVVPNLYIPDYGSRITSSIYARGIGARMDQPALGLTIDNVPIFNKNGFDFDVADISSVEMLRGPQSVLYGRNTMAGMMNITTLSPMRWQGFKFMALGARGNEYKLSAGWYHKFSDKFATGVNGNFSMLGGFYHNQFNNKLLDKERSGALRWKSVWRPNHKLYLQNTLAASILRQGGYPYESVATGEVNYNDTCFYRRFMLTDGLSLRYTSEKFTLNSVTSLQWLDDNMTLDQDFMPDPYFVLTQKQKDLAVTQDLYFRGSELEDKYTWLGGVFGFYRNLDMTAPVTFKDKGISSLIEEHRNEANPDYPIMWTTRQFPLNSDFRMPTWGIAMYHESNFRVGNVELNAGIRLNYEESRLKYLSNCNTVYNIMHRNQDGELGVFHTVDLDINDGGKLSRRYFNWLPKFSVLYHFPSENGNVYGSVSKGYKSGGFNTQMFSDVLQQRLMHIMGIGAQYDVNDVVGYKPEYSWNYEIGMHNSWLGGNLESELSIFYIDCRDQQLTVFPSGTTTGRMMANAGKTRSVGAELSLYVEATDWLKFNGSFGYTDARFRKYNNGISDFKGKRIPYVPNTTVFLQGLIEKSVDWGKVDKVNFDVNLRSIGKIYWNESNSLSQKPYVLLGASIGADVGDVNIQVWGKNLTGSKYQTFYFLSMGHEFVQRGRPWQVGATIRISISEKVR